MNLPLGAVDSMHSFRLLGRACFGFAVSFLAAVAGHASSEGDAIVARVGSSTVKRSEVEFRMRALPAFQREAMGLSEPELARKVLEEGILYDEMLAQEAKAGVVVRDARVRWHLRRAQANASLAVLKARVPPVTPEHVATYYEAHRSDFDTPERVQIWRLLVDDEKQAKSVLRDLSKATDAETWSRLVLEKSIDQATRMRGGNLGFVSPDGRSNEAGLNADPAVYRAALAVKDGEWATAPVREGNYWAVVWRRGSLKAQKRSVEDARVQIASTLLKERQEEGRNAELQRLRSAQHVELHPDLVGLVTLAPVQQP